MEDRVYCHEFIALRARYSNLQKDPAEEHQDERDDQRGFFVDRLQASPDERNRAESEGVYRSGGCP